MAKIIDAQTFISMDYQQAARFARTQGVFIVAAGMAAWTAVKVAATRDAVRVSLMHGREIVSVAFRRGATDVSGVWIPDAAQWRAHAPITSRGHGLGLLTHTERK